MPLSGGGCESVHRPRFLALHPLRPLRAGLQRGAGERRDQLRVQGIGRQDRHQGGQGAQGFGLRLLRRVRAGLSGGSALRQAAASSRAGRGRFAGRSGQGAHHLFVLRGGLSAASPRAAGEGGRDLGDRGCGSELRQFVREGKVRVRFHSPREPAQDAPDPGERIVQRGFLGGGARPGRRKTDADPG